MSRHRIIRAALLACMIGTLAISSGATYAQEGEPTYELPYENLPPVTLPPVAQHQVLVLIADHPNSTQPIPSNAQIQNQMDVVRDYYLENSYEMVDFDTLQVFGGVVLDTEPTCSLSITDTNQTMNEAIANADSGVDYSAFSHVMIYAPFGADCNWGGLYKGVNTLSTGEGSVDLDISLINVRHNGGPAVPAHELGHSLGLGHAQFLNCDTTFPENASACSSYQYGDLYSVMGTVNPGGPAFHISAAQKDLLGWFDADDMVNVLDSGTFKVETISADVDSIKGLRICRAPGEYLYIETRREVGFDDGITRNGLRDVTGAMLHLLSDSSSQLLDATPDVDNSFFTTHDATLKPGAPPLIDPVSGVSIEVLSAGHKAAQVKIVDPSPTTIAGPAGGLSCNYHDTQPAPVAVLIWQNADCYDEIEIRRDGQLIENHPGWAEGFAEVSPPGGLREYEITPIIDGLPSISTSCTLDIPCPPCKVDYDGNGIVDLADIGSFSNYFSSGDLQADLNCDDALNLADVSILSDIMAQGGICP